jgi:hypothetical protein
MEMDVIHTKIHTFRGVRVMLDYDLADLYEMETKNLNLAVKRNLLRFPDDFMFRLTKEEFESLRLQNVTSKRGGTRYLPYAFTEQGVAMLSGVLNSPKAIQVNIAIMRIFVKIRQYMLHFQVLADKLAEHEQQFADVYEVLDYLMNKDKLSTAQQERTRIGFIKES